MFSRKNRNCKTASRRRKGSQIAEFAAAMVLLVFVILLPFLDFAILPVRWLLAQEIVNAYVRKLALCETYSQAYEILEADPSLTTRLERLGGVKCRKLKLRMRVARVFLNTHPIEVLAVEKPGQIPPVWLPDGEKSPCIYNLELEVQAMISPAILAPASGGLSVPGITTPVPFLITASRNWENLGRNPITKRYFINE
jgi:hypothetical protein